MPLAQAPVERTYESGDEQEACQALQALDQDVMVVTPCSPRGPPPVRRAAPELGPLLEREEEEIRLDKEAEDRVGVKWDAEFGHCFPDLMEGLPGQN